MTISRERTIFISFTVLDNIILGAEDTKMGFLQKQEVRKKVQAISEKYKLQVDLDAKVENISVGMQQRTQILKMLYRDNEILIFDEPTGSAGLYLQKLPGTQSRGYPLRQGKQIRNCRMRRKFAAHFFDK